MADKTNYQTLDGLKAHPLYAVLTPRQQTFLLTYLTNGKDRVEAAKAAYTSVQPDVTAIRVLRTPNIRKLISIYHGTEQHEPEMAKAELLGLIVAKMRDPLTRGTAFSVLLQAYLEITGKRKRPERSQKRESESAVDESVDELVRQIEAGKVKP